MSTVETKLLDINIMTLGKFTARLDRINAPLTIQRLMKALPLKGRVLKQGTMLVMPTGLKVRPESPRGVFSRGDLSIDPSSANLSIHLENDSQSRREENYLGRIQEEIVTKGMLLSSGILIKEHS